MFTIHFIGDIHQPLHVGFEGDQGGNTYTGTFEGTPDRKLHQVWDEDMLEKRLGDYNGNNATYLKYFMDRMQHGDWASQVASWRTCPTGTDPTGTHACSDAWAAQSAVYACTTAYVDSTGAKIRSGFNLGNPYYAFALPVAEVQLARGGVRLANVINAIFSQADMAEYTLPPHEFKQAQRRKEGRRGKMMRGGAAVVEDIALV
jgi:hypothetical protein